MSRRNKPAGCGCEPRLGLQSVSVSDRACCEFCSLAPCHYVILSHCPVRSASGELLLNRCTVLRKDCITGCTWSSRWHGDNTSSASLSETPDQCDSLYDTPILRVSRCKFGCQVNGGVTPPEQAGGGGGGGVIPPMGDCVSDDLCNGVRCFTATVTLPDFSQYEPVNPDFPLSVENIGCLYMPYIEDGIVDPSLSAYPHPTDLRLSDAYGGSVDLVLRYNRTLGYESVISPCCYSDGLVYSVPNDPAVSGWPFGARVTAGSVSASYCPNTLGDDSVGWGMSSFRIIIGLPFVLARTVGGLGQLVVEIRQFVFDYEIPFSEDHCQEGGTFNLPFSAMYYNFGNNIDVIVDTDEDIDDAQLSMSPVDDADDCAALSESSTNNITGSLVNIVIDNAECHWYDIIPELAGIPGYDRTEEFYPCGYFTKWLLTHTADQTTLELSSRSGETAVYSADRVDGDSCSAPQTVSLMSYSDSLAGRIPLHLCVVPSEGAPWPVCDTPQAQCGCCEKGEDLPFSIFLSGCNNIVALSSGLLTRKKVAAVPRCGVNLPDGASGGSGSDPDFPCGYFDLDLNGIRSCDEWSGSVLLVIYCTGSTYVVDVYCYNNEDDCYVYQGAATITFYECRCGGPLFALTLPALDCCCPEPCVTTAQFNIDISSDCSTMDCSGITVTHNGSGVWSGNAPPECFVQMDPGIVCVGGVYYLRVTLPTCATAQMPGTVVSDPGDPVVIVFAQTAFTGTPGICCSPGTFNVSAVATEI